MNYKDIVSNVNVYGLEDAIKGSKYPMAVDLSKVNDELTPTAISLAKSGQGQGHDNWLNGVIVQFDLTFTNKAWVEAERYHFLDFISSQSTMHRITKFDLDKSYIEYVDPRMIEIMKDLVKAYNQAVDKTKEIEKHIKENDVNFEYNETNLNTYKDLSKKLYLNVLYSNPAGFRLTAKMTTNYRQLKTIYNQRRHHRLPEWREFCKWIETLPYSELITGVNRKIIECDKYSDLKDKMNCFIRDKEIVDVSLYTSEDNHNTKYTATILYRE